MTNKQFEFMYDKAINIALMKDGMTGGDAQYNDFEFLRHDGEYITVVGTLDTGMPIEVDFPAEYLELGFKQVETLIEAQIQKVKTLNPKRLSLNKNDNGCYTWLRK